jgi:hypothetical protein
MNKAVGGGIAVIVIIGIIVLAYSFTTTESTIADISENDVLDLEETNQEEPTQSGREFSVELSDSIGLTTP